MKNIFKKLSCALLAAAMICAITPFTASAATAISYPKTQTIYMDSKNTTYSYGGISINNIPSKTSISKANIKVVSGKNIIELNTLTNSTWSDRTEYFGNGLKPYTYSNHYYNIGLRIKKAGTAKISFKVGSKTYYSTIKTLPYTNPIKSLTVTGFSGNLASKFKTNSYNAFGVQNKKSQTNAYIKCTAASGWKITNISFYNRKTSISRSISCNATPVSSLSLLAGNLSAKQTGNVNIGLKNTKTGGTMYCTLNLG